MRKKCSEHVDDISFLVTKQPGMLIKTFGLDKFVPQLNVSGVSHSRKVACELQNGPGLHRGRQIQNCAKDTKKHYK